MAKRDTKTKAPAPAAPDLLSLIKREARDRFSSVALRGLTPARVQEILTGAFAGDPQQQSDLFALMQETWPRLVKCANELKHAIQQASWDVQAATAGDGEPSAEAQRRRDLVMAALRPTQWRPSRVRDENGWSGLLYDLTDAWLRGISVQEIFWHRVQDAQLGNCVFPRATRYVSARYYAWPTLVDQTDELRLFPDGNRAGQGQAWPEQKFLISISKSVTGHATRGALLRSLAVIWMGASFSWDWMVNLAQVFGLPIRWVEYDSAATQQQVMGILSMLEQMGSAGYAAFPAGTKLALHELSKDAGQSPQAWVIDFADRACDLLVLGQTLTSTQGERGSQSLGEVHAGVRQDVIVALGRWCEEELQDQLVRPICQLNFGDELELPTFCFDLDLAEDAKALAERDKILIGELGLPVLRSWLYTRHDVPMPEPGDDVFVRPTAAPAAPGARPGAPAIEARAASQRSADEQLLDHVLESLTGVEARWLAGVRPEFERLVRLARSEQITDELFAAEIQAAARTMPELFARLDHAAVEDALFAAMSSSLVNGVSQAFMARRVKRANAREVRP